jgi:hypothetical protein
MGIASEEAGHGVPAAGAYRDSHRPAAGGSSGSSAGSRLGDAATSIRVLDGNAGDPAAFTEIAGAARKTFGLQRMVMAGDRGMITSARIGALKAEDEKNGEGKYAWITALRSPAIRKLMAGDGPLQLSL